MRTEGRRGGAVGQFLKFNLVGIVNTLLDMAVFAALVWLGAHYAVAQCVSYGCGMANSYWLNRTWTFQAGRRAGASQLVKFLLLNLTVLALSVLLLVVFASGWQLPALAKLLVTALTVVLNFAGSRYWVFR